MNSSEEFKDFYFVETIGIFNSISNENYDIISHFVFLHVFECFMELKFCSFKLAYAVFSLNMYSIIRNSL